MTQTINIRPRQPTGQETTGLPSLSIDWDLYGQYLEDSDLSDAEKQEFIEVLWSIVISFVDLGFGLHPAQLVTGDSCEQNAGRLISKSSPVVNSPHTANRQSNTAEFMASARRTPDPAQQERSPK